MVFWSLAQCEDRRRRGTNFGHKRGKPASARGRGGGGAGFHQVRKFCCRLAQAPALLLQGNELLNNIAALLMLALMDPSDNVAIQVMRKHPL